MTQNNCDIYRKSEKCHRMYVLENKPINNAHQRALTYILIKGHFTSTYYLKVDKINTWTFCLNESLQIIYPLHHLSECIVN